MPLPPDTIWNGEEMELQISLENDQRLGGTSLGFVVTGDPGVSWTWNSSPIASVVPGSRMDPPGTVWDLGGFMINTKDIDGVSPDSFMVGGMGISGGLQPGPMEHMITLNLAVEGGTPTDDFLFCIDSAFIPPYGDFIFSFPTGFGTAPIVNWGNTGRCWVVKPFPNVCPEWDAGLPTELTINHCDSGSVVLSAIDDDGDDMYFEVNGIVGGAGTASIVNNNDGTMVLTYHPTLSDVGQAISIDVDVYDDAHAVGSCSVYTVDVSVTNRAPFIDCGESTYAVYEGYDINKTDIAHLELDDCDVSDYLLISGPGSMDQSTGLYSWLAATGQGTWPVTVAVTDNIDTARCSFTVEVLPPETDTCGGIGQTPGDVNSDGSINISDIAYLNNFLYAGGPPPVLLSNADPDGDCFIDEADIKYLTEAILGSGPAPVGCTCVNPALCDCFVADANNDLSVNIGDAVHIINYIFNSGPSPTPYAICSGDANGDCTCNIGDAVYLITYIFKSGPRPPYCHEWIDDSGCGWVERK